MNAIFEAALEVERACRSAGFSFCFIGGLAVQRWGQPRMTADVDLTLLTGFGGEEPFVDALLARFAGRLPDARDFALRHRTVLLVATNGIHVDVALGAMPFAGRDKDWLDVRSIVVRQGAALDHATIWDELLPLLDLREDETTEARLRALLEAT